MLVGEVKVFLNGLGDHQLGMSFCLLYRPAPCVINRLTFYLF